MAILYLCQEVSTTSCAASCKRQIFITETEKCENRCKGIRLCMASYEGISVDTVAHVDVNIVE